MAQQTSCTVTRILLRLSVSRTQRSARDPFKSLATRDYSSMSSGLPSNLPSLTIYLRDINAAMIEAWNEAFRDKKYSEYIKASMPD